MGCLQLIPHHPPLHASARARTHTNRASQLEVTARARYNQNEYDFNGENNAPVSVCELGQKLKDGELTLENLKARNEDGSPKYGISRSTMQG